jgi:hypothetical protein
MQFINKHAPFMMGVYCMVHQINLMSKFSLNLRWWDMWRIFLQCRLFISTFTLITPFSSKSSQLVWNPKVVRSLEMSRPTKIYASWGGHLVHFKNDMWHNIGSMKFFWHKIYKRIMKSSLKVDNPMTSKIDRYKIWAILFCRNNIRAKNKDPRMYVY